MKTRSLCGPARPQIFAQLRVGGGKIKSIIIHFCFGVAAHHCTLSVFTISLQTEKHFRASRNLLITVIHISITIIILNLKY